MRYPLGDYSIIDLLQAMCPDMDMSDYILREDEAIIQLKS